MQNTQRKLHYNGLSLIEILIAIAVFGIGIISILQIITSNVGLIDHTTIQTQASLLTKEAMEGIFHHRNTNTMFAIQWSCETNPHTCTYNDNCEITQAVQTQGCNTLLSGYYIFDHTVQGGYRLQEITINENDTNSIREQARLYNYDNQRLHQEPGTYDETKQTTEFARYLKISPRTIPNTTSSPDMLHIQAHTFYMKGSLTGHISFHTLIGPTDSP